MTLVMSECCDCCLVYINDLLVYSESMKAYKTHVTRVFATLTKAKLKAKLSKCAYLVPLKWNSLGMSSLYGTINMEASKKNAIIEWKPPLVTTAKQV